MKRDNFTMPIGFADELITDNFAGGGGTSTGLVTTFGRPVHIAINHDPKALAMHAANYPDKLHLCESVWDKDTAVLNSVTKSQFKHIDRFLKQCVLAAHLLVCFGLGKNVIAVIEKIGDLLLIERTHFRYVGQTPCRHRSNRNPRRKQQLTFVSKRYQSPIKQSIDMRSQEQSVVSIQPFEITRCSPGFYMTRRQKRRFFHMCHSAHRFNLAQSCSIGSMPTPRINKLLFHCWRQIGLLNLTFLFVLVFSCRKRDMRRHPRQCLERQAQIIWNAGQIYRLFTNASLIQRSISNTHIGSNDLPMILGRDRILQHAPLHPDFPAMIHPFSIKKIIRQRPLSLLIFMSHNANRSNFFLRIGKDYVPAFYTREIEITFLLSCFRADCWRPNVVSIPLLPVSCIVINPPVIDRHAALSTLDDQVCNFRRSTNFFHNAQTYEKVVA